MLYSSAVSLIAARGYFFCLETKEAKIQVTSLCFFATQGLYPAKRGSTTGCLDLPFGFARTLATATYKFKRPLAAAQANQCSHAFAQSWEDDESPSQTLPEREGFKHK
jgi:hypothetical protein